MALTSLRDARVEPFAGGRVWDAAGAYEWESAVAEFAVDPAHPGNGSIADLALAPRTSGRVGFDADLRILRPAAGGNGRLLLLVPNRGMYGGVPFSLDAPLQFGTSELPAPGDGFLLKQGWTIAWCGWQWDVIRGTGGIGLDAPPAEVEPGWLRVEFRPDAPQPTHALSDSSLLFTFRDYPTSDLGDPSAVLTHMLVPDGTPSVIERSRWRFVDATTVELDGGFEPFHWYTLTYRSRHAPVAGTGLLAIRDTVSWLRRERDLDHAFAYGVSQSGRLLRQFLFDGLQPGRSGEAGLRRGLRAYRGRPARRVQPPLRPALADPPARLLEPAALRHGEPAGTATKPRRGAQAHPHQ